LIVGTVTDEDAPVVELALAGREWFAIVDTGFNGDLELPDDLRADLPHEYLGRAYSILAGGQRIEEDAYLVEIPFDGEMISAEVTFVPGKQILIGTHLLRRHVLEIDFPVRTVKIKRVQFA
jgi:predicted aspartyl protease